MDTGYNQAIYYGAEVTHGEFVVPSVNLGIVTGGTLNEGTEVVKRVGLVSKGALAQKYTKAICGGSCTVLLQDLALLNWALRATPSSNLPSYTLDCGLFNGVNMRRMVGSKVNSLRLHLDVTTPVTADIEWTSIYAENGQAGYIPPPPLGIWVPGSMTLVYDYGGAGGAEIADLTSLDVDVNNALQPRYLANRQERSFGSQRNCSYIEERTQEITATIRCFDRIPPAARNMFPVHAEAGMAIVLTLVDVCGQMAPGVIILHDCFQTGIHEELVPNEIIPYECNLSVTRITF